LVNFITSSPPNKRKAPLQNCKAPLLTTFLRRFWFSTLVSGLEHYIQPIYRTLVAIEEVFLKAGWAAVIEEICKSVRPQQQLFA